MKAGADLCDIETVRLMVREAPDVVRELSTWGVDFDKENNLLVGLIPNIDDCKYFGYGKKPILTLHNVLCILNDHLPLHCGCTRYVVRFDEAVDNEALRASLSAVFVDALIGYIVGGCPGG